MKKKKIKIDGNFQITDEIMKDFYNYLDSVKFNYQSLSQLRYEEFKLGTGLKDTTDSTGKSISIYPEKPNWSQSELEELKRYHQSWIRFSRLKARGHSRKRVGDKEISS